MTRTLAIAALIFTACLAPIGCDSKKSTESGQPAGTGAAFKEMSLDLGNQVTMRLVRIPAGNFLMGSPRTDKDRALNEMQYQVTLSKPFYMGVHEVRVDQYAQFVAATGHRHAQPDFQQTGDHPVVNVSWDDAQAFCKWVSARTGKSVSLPTEAQWEYACRAGSTTRYNSGDSERSLNDFGWHQKNSDLTTPPVGRKKPNAWGLYALHGNAWEWCSDWYAN
jgi:formylglycine-generating enzyme required for sulfatase activity